MAGATREETFDISAAKFYAAVVDYEHYPKLLPEVDAIEVLDKSEKAARVRYKISIVKTFSYVLKMTQKRPEGISWELESGDLFKSNSGSWEIRSLGPEKCQVTYKLDVNFKVFAPSAITNKLVAVNLPRMMQAFYEHAKSLR